MDIKVLKEQLAHMSQKELEYSALTHQAKGGMQVLQHLIMLEEKSTASVVAKKKDD